MWVCYGFINKYSSFNEFVCVQASSEKEVFSLIFPRPKTLIPVFKTEYKFFTSTLLLICDIMFIVCNGIFNIGEGVSYGWVLT